ncbi:MAG: hypothetical protein IJG68_02420 [Bacilli bacterium]|nr:hypothetical protein [Bacilli bacterium]
MIIKKLSYKHIVIFLTIISVILLVIVKNEPTDQYIKTIMISLSINIVLSIVIIFMIDIKKENDTKRHIAERRKIIYKSLILPIREYNNLIYNLYKATTKKEKINLKYFNNNLDKDKIFKNIELLDVYKEGCIYDIYKKICYGKILLLMNILPTSNR